MYEIADNFSTLSVICNEHTSIFNSGIIRRNFFACFAYQYVTFRKYTINKNLCHTIYNPLNNKIEDTNIKYYKMIYHTFLAILEELTLFIS